MPYPTTLTDPLTTSPMGNAIGWIQAVTLGTVAMVIAIIAVAAIGMLMLTGRFELRRGIVVILGCFILFGARGIGDALGGLVSSDPGIVPAFPITSLAIPAPASDMPVQGYDPYAGASLPPTRQESAYQLTGRVQTYSRLRKMAVEDQSGAKGEGFGESTNEFTV